MNGISVRDLSVVLDGNPILSDVSLELARGRALPIAGLIPIPGVGDEVLREVGFSAAEIDDLRSEGVV